MLAKVAVHILNAVQELGFRLALYAEAGQAVHTEQLVVYRGLGVPDSRILSQDEERQ